MQIIVNTKFPMMKKSKNRHFSQIPYDGQGGWKYASFERSEMGWKSFVH